MFIPHPYNCLSLISVLQLAFLSIPSSKLLLTFSKWVDNLNIFWEFFAVHSVSNSGGLKDVAFLVMCLCTYRYAPRYSLNCLMNRIPSLQLRKRLS
jgi:hypothetical protein